MKINYQHAQTWAGVEVAVQSLCNDPWPQFHRLLDYSGTECCT